MHMAITPLIHVVTVFNHNFDEFGYIILQTIITLLLGLRSESVIERVKMKIGYIW